MAKIKIWSVLTVVVLTIIVILQNTESVETRFLFATITMPRAALLAITLLVGVATGFIFSLYLTKKKDK